jgi:hypothetical protein
MYVKELYKRRKLETAFELNKQSLPGGSVCGPLHGINDSPCRQPFSVTEDTGSK